MQQLHEKIALLFSFTLFLYKDLCCNPEFLIILRLALASKRKDLLCKREKMALQSVIIIRLFVQVHLCNCNLYIQKEKKKKEKEEKTKIHTVIEFLKRLFFLEWFLKIMIQ